ATMAHVWVPPAARAREEAAAAVAAGASFPSATAGEGAPHPSDGTRAASSAPTTTNAVQRRDRTTEKTSRPRTREPCRTLRMPHYPARTWGQPRVALMPLVVVAAVMLRGVAPS